GARRIGQRVGAGAGIRPDNANGPAPEALRSRNAVLVERPGDLCRRRTEGEHDGRGAFAQETSQFSGQSTPAVIKRKAGYDGVLRPVRLLVSQYLREQRQYRKRRVLALEQRDFRRGRQAEVSPQTVPWLEPGAEPPFAPPEQETVKGGAKEPQLRQERDLGEHRWIINRKEAEGLEESG